MITLQHLTDLCARLNHESVKYVVIGGCAIFLHGYERTTRDIDLLVESSAENIEKLKKALKDLLPEAVPELLPEDIEKNTVVRMSGKDLVVDLLKKVGDVDFEYAWKNHDIETINGVEVPFANLDAMLRLKEGVRDVDKRDYLFLKGKKEYLEKE